MTAALPPLTLILGGARSGKSRQGERLVEAQAGACIYIATGEAGDAEMAARIRHHRQRRGPRWRTIEAPLDLVPALQSAAAPHAAVLVDCLTLWLGNLLGAERDLETERHALLAALPALRGPVLLISNEVGLGIVPDNALARRFRDEAGLLHQALAEAAQSVLLMVAGIPMTIKGPL
jgi:adenosylcobinamide kinase/adenosylcobinamide-phosphate guanylyltransferase